MKETQGSMVGRRVHGLSFLGCKRLYADRLSSHWPNNYGAILCKPPRSNTEKDTRKKGQIWQGKKSSFVRKMPARTQVLLSWQKSMN